MGAKGKGSELKARRAVIETALAMSRSGLSPGRSGNVSCRYRDGMLITPSGMPYADIRPRDVVFRRRQGRRCPTGGHAKPSSEWRFHLAAYHARPDMNAGRAHALAQRHRARVRTQPIPAFHYMVAVAGGSDIPLVAYDTFGTKELARFVAKGLLHRNACLMANHGQVALGTTLASALELCKRGRGSGGAVQQGDRRWGSPTSCPTRRWRAC